MTTEKNYSGLYFLGGVILIYIVILIINSKIFTNSLIFFKDIFIKVIPLLFFIFALMSLTNYFVKPKVLVKYLGKNSGIKGWFISIISGIISSGPIYMWYPLLNYLQKQGMRPALIATFLYNRAVKIHILPLLIVYFGLIYSIVLMIIMVLISILQGFLTEKIIKLKN